ncbi:hypothetical protein [Corynebacterium lubricantis]|uniref:hypothetical protein n=1 Tax=Corynebacterium lubricantis TaxID=541095 RepID=UPI0003778E43|nr:hypothetical protein [Corynebacterium lubricantis]
MTKRRNEDANSDITDQLKPLIDDDAFLTSLSRGEDPSGGEDELAQLLLELRQEVNGQMPPAPVIEGGEEVADDGANGSGESTDAAVLPLGPARNKRRVNPWLAGFVGAAASAVVVVGSGAAIYNATPGSALWPISTAIYGDRTAVVELAGTLDEMQSATDNGDEDRARELLSQARSIVGDMKEGTDVTATDARANQSREAGTPGTETVTVTVTRAPRDAAESSQRESAESVTDAQVATVTETVTPSPGAPVTVTQTETQTQTQVETVYVEAPVRENPLPPTQAPVEVEPQPTAAPVAPQQY